MLQDEQNTPLEAHQVITNIESGKSFSTIHFQQCVWAKLMRLYIDDWDSQSHTQEDAIEEQQPVHRRPGHPRNRPMSDDVESIENLDGKRRRAT